MAREETRIQKKESENIETVERTRSGKTFVPATDIYETENEIVLLADMPGVDQKSIDVTLENNQLTIQGCVPQIDIKDHALTYAEYDVGDYYRVFTISDTIDRNKIGAEYKDGVLRLKLPKAEEAKARKINVSVG